MTLPLKLQAPSRPRTAREATAPAGPANSNQPEAGTTPSDLDRALSIYAAIASGGDDEMLRYVVVPGPPASKARPRFGKGGKVYHPGDNRAAEQRTAWFLRRNFPDPLTGNVALGCVFFRPDFQRIDTDNLLKHVCDAANGVLWADDVQVTAVLGIAEYDPENPRTLVVIGRHRSTLLRGTDATIPCQGCGKPFPFIGKSKTQKYCSSACYQATKPVSLVEPVLCAQCGEPFRRKTSSQKFCSMACSAPSRRRPRPERRKQSFCADCGKPVSKPGYERCRDCWTTARGGGIA